MIDEGDCGAICGIKIFIRDVLNASSPGPPATLTEDLHGFSSFLQENVGILSLLGHNPLLMNYFQFITAFSEVILLYDIF
jgi:hypothetical protein